jgi:hypothetical protein
VSLRNFVVEYGYEKEITKEGFKMKNITTISVVASLLATMLLTGCSTAGQPKPLETKDLVSKYKALPTWVTTDADKYQSSGSSLYHGQSFIEQKTEAETSAYAALVRRLETKVDVLVKNHYSIAGNGTNPYTEKFHTQTIQQLSSFVVSGSRVVDTYISPSDGELFILIAVDENAVNKLTTNVEKAFLELDTKAKVFNDEKKSSKK